ncbi:MAG TPA: FAD-dependent oxidoreductase [bacterium]|nr:FAD-dependent oxidoreductase [bacterium]
MDDRKDRSPVIILGAGICGLYAAHKLAERKIPVIVLEKEAVPGGLAAGFERNGNCYDLGVHHLHGFDREILTDIQNLMGERLQPVELKALIRHGKGFHQYPLQFTDMLGSIPPWTLVGALSGILIQQIINQFDKSTASDAEEALVRIYGRPLYNYFFRDFTHAYWGLPASQLSAVFVRSKMPRLSAVDVIKDHLKKLGFRFREESTASALCKETLWYAPSGSREVPEALANAIINDGGKVLMASPVVRIDTADNKIQAVHFSQEGKPCSFPCSYCLSTIPLPDLIRALHPVPDAKVLDAVGHLHYKPIAVFGLLVCKTKVLNALYVHFRKRIFHRLAEPKNSGLQVSPEGCTVLIAEMTCEVGDDRWFGGSETRSRLLQDLQAEGLITPEEILEIHHFNARHAYPIFNLGFEEHFQKVMAQLQQIENLQSVGRQGGFSYPNMHATMRMGADATKLITSYLNGC